MSIRQEFVRNAFGRCAVAFIFTLVHFRIGADGRTFDLLPDVVGYALFATSAATFRSVDPAADDMRRFAATAGGLAAVGTVLGLAGIRSPVLALLGITTAVVDIVMVMRLCDVVMRLGEATNDTALTEHARSRRALYLWAEIAIACLALAAVPATLLIALPLSIAVVVLMFRLMREAQRAAPRLYPAR